MTVRIGFSNGEVCWTDLQTRDVEAAKSFYSAVFGWHFEDLPTPDGRSYAKAFLGGDLVTVIAPQSPLQEAKGTAAQWNIYFAADDAQAIAADVPHAGGTLQFGPEAVADTGVMVFLEPPGGGTTGVWEAGTHFGVARHHEAGAFAWAELLTPEPQVAVGFFQQLFGQEVTEYPQDDGGTYTTLMVDGAEVAGLAPLPDDGADTGDSADAESGGTEDGAEAEGTTSAEWQVYFGVASVAEAVRDAVAAGAEVLVEPDESGDGGSIATVRDPQGGVFSLLEV